MTTDIPMYVLKVLFRDLVRPVKSLDERLSWSHLVSPRYIQKVLPGLVSLETAVCLALQSLLPQEEIDHSPGQEPVQDALALAEEHSHVLLFHGRSLQQAEISDQGALGSYHLNGRPALVLEIEVLCSTDERLHHQLCLELQLRVPPVHITASQTTQCWTAPENSGQNCQEPDHQPPVLGLPVQVWYVRGVSFSWPP